MSSGETSMSVQEWINVFSTVGNMKKHIFKTSTFYLHVVSRVLGQSTCHQLFYRPLVQFIKWNWVNQFKFNQLLFAVDWTACSATQRAKSESILHVNSCELEKWMNLESSQTLLNLKCHQNAKIKTQSCHICLSSFNLLGHNMIKFML